MKGIFPSILKNANITPVSKKRFRGSKDNYQPVSTLPIISKMFEITIKTNNCIWTSFSLNINVGLEKDVICSIVF